MKQITDNSDLECNQFDILSHGIICAIFTRIGMKLDIKLVSYGLICFLCCYQFFAGGKDQRFSIHLVYETILVSLGLSCKVVIKFVFICSVLRLAGWTSVVNAQMDGIHLTLGGSVSQPIAGLLYRPTGPYGMEI